MDPILILLAAQLLIIMAILLTSGRSKASAASLSLKALVQGVLPMTADIHCEEETCDADLNVSDETESPSKDALVIAEKTCSQLEKTETPETASGLKTRRKKKQNLKINEQRLHCAQKRSKRETVNSVGFAASYVQRSVSVISALILRCVRAAGHLFVKQPFKGDSAVELDGSLANDTTARLVSVKPIESSYLIKIIAMRKAEKILRIKVARLNMAVMKSRGVRPLQMIPEVAEIEA